MSILSDYLILIIIYNHDVFDMKPMFAIIGSWVESEVACLFFRIFTVALLPYLFPAGGSNPAGPIF